MTTNPGNPETLKRDHLYPIAFEDRAHLPTHDNVRPRDIRAVWTGEKRPPKRGEWFLSGGVIEAYYAPNDISHPYHIARLVRAVATFTFEPIES